MAYKVLALNTSGNLTYCTCPPELRGKGRCNHITHQENNETTEEFVKRIESIKITNKRKPFIPSEGCEITVMPYRMTPEERASLTKIENRMQLDQNIEGGYIEVDEPLWNDMDKNYFSQMSGIPVKDINAVLTGNGYIVIESEDPKYPEGKVIPKDCIEDIQKQGINIKLATGVIGMNRFANDVYGWQATKFIYVLPYYMRIGAGDEIASDLTVAYKYLLRNRNNPDKQQIAYEALLNNSALSKEYSRYTDGFRNKSLADEFAGKGGVFRAYLSGSSIPYSARSVVTPNKDLKYGELRIPPAIAVDIFRPTLLKSLAYDGYSEEEIDAYFAACRMPQTEVPKEIREDLERRICNKRVIMNRQPSLHTSSLQSYIPKISDNATTQVHPLYVKAYGMDFDGDAVSLYGINSDDIIPTVDKTIDSKNYINTHIPRNMESSSILPSKEALWGLLNILDRRSK